MRAKAASADLHDALTGLPGRPLLAEHLGLALARAREEDRQVALLHLGLDDFKLVNDGLGHAAGDAVLREIAGRLRDRLRDSNLVARSGADEFCVLLADIEGDPGALVEIVVGQINAAIEEPLAVGDAQFQLGASVGASLFPHDAGDVETLLQHADAAMYEAKGSGRGAFAFYAGGTQDRLERLTLSTRLREALERGDFRLHYQPIVTLGDGRVVGVEALLRWCDEPRGLIAPIKFIPVAEYTGLIDRIGDWVIDAACVQARAWRDEGLTTSVSVNVSLGQFAASGFAAGVCSRLDAHGLEPSALTVEITESTVMRDPACVEPILRELREAGVRVAIDDFGTGYSSLSRLADLAVDVLKIDRAFLRNVPDDEEATRLARAAVDLVNALGREVVAEGVETEAQRRFLVRSGCGLGQGFHLGRPLPPEDATQVLRARGAQPAGV